MNTSDPTAQEVATRRETIGPRVGLFGLLGAGNIGNDGTLDAVLSYLVTEQPDAVLDFMCSGPERVSERCGLPATHLHWHREDSRQGSGIGSLAIKGLRIGLGVAIDALRTASWVRRHDVVIVPGMGVLEATLPLRPWQTPYSMFLLCSFGRLFRTKVALVSVGANVIEQRLTRWLLITAARLAFYRSFRDESSRDALRLMGLDCSHDEVYPDLAFHLPTPEGDLRSEGTVGVGVMAYFGGNDDRRRGAEIHAEYLEKMKVFVRWLVDHGHRVRFFTGDEVDEPVVWEIIEDLRRHRPELGLSSAIVEPVYSLHELMRQMASVDSVVATRFHNVLCSLKLAKPTLSIGYAAKNDVLMANMGMAGYCQSIRNLDVDQLIEQFTMLEREGQGIKRTLIERNFANRQLLEQQFDVLSTALFEAPAPRPP